MENIEIDTDASKFKSLGVRLWLDGVVKTFTDKATMDAFIKKLERGKKSYCYIVIGSGRPESISM